MTKSTFTQLVGFTGDDVPRAVFPFIVVRPKMLMARMTRGVQNIWFFWEMTSYVSVFSLWFDSGYIFLSVYRGLALDCRKLRVSAVAVHRWSLTSFSCGG